MTIRTAIVGFGKIARDQHVPAIRADARFMLAAVTSRSGDPDIGVPAFADLGELLRDMPGQIDAVAICTPPDARHAIARQALEAGLAVLLEKPPAATLGEVEDLVQLARQKGLALYAGWHSQHAPAVSVAADLLRGTTVRRFRIDWCEDVRKWHPGQDWVWQPGGFGVFDTGINALSIATAILPDRLMLSAARLEIPADRQGPIAATLAFIAAGHEARFDWRHTDGELWRIAIETSDGTRLDLLDGGARLLVDRAEQLLPPAQEYRSIYARFAELVETRMSDVDIEPLRIVADAFLIGERSTVAPFAWNAPC